MHSKTIPYRYRRLCVLIFFFLISEKHFIFSSVSHFRNRNDEWKKWKEMTWRQSCSFKIWKLISFHSFFRYIIACNPTCFCITPFFSPIKISICNNSLHVSSRYDSNVPSHVCWRFWFHIFIFFHLHYNDTKPKPSKMYGFFSRKYEQIELRYKYGGIC